MVCPTYPPYDTSGATRYYYDVARKFAEKGIYVDVVTSPVDKVMVKREGKITIHRLSCMEWNDRTDSKGQTERLLRYLRKLCEKKKIDIISSQHLNNWSFLNPGYSIATNIVAVENKIPNILTVHNPYGLTNENAPEKIALLHMFWDKIISVSSFISEKIHSIGVDVNLISTCYPGVDLASFKPDLGRKWLQSRIGVKERERIILFAGRIEDGKGIPELLNSFATIANRTKNVKLLIAAGRISPKLKDVFDKSVEKTYEKAKLLGIRDKIIIQPFELDEMPRVYSGADIFVLPTRAEAFGLVYVEAMACGLPVIGTSVGGVPEIISNGEDGYLVPPEDPTELTKKIEWLLKNKSKRIAMGKKGVEKASKKFNLDKNIEKLIGVYNSTLCQVSKKKTAKNKNSGIQAVLNS